MRFDYVVAEGTDKAKITNIEGGKKMLINFARGEGFDKAYLVGIIVDFQSEAELMLLHATAEDFKRYRVRTEKQMRKKVIDNFKSVTDYITSFRTGKEKYDVVIASNPWKRCVTYMDATSGELTNEQLFNLIKYTTDCMGAYYRGVKSNG